MQAFNITPLLLFFTNHSIFTHLGIASFFRARRSPPPSPKVPIRLWTYLTVCLSVCLPNYLPTYTTYLPAPEKPFISDAFREPCKGRV